MKEREINLIDLMVEMLLRWRMILVWMLVGGLALGGLSYVQSARSVSAQNTAMNQAKDKQEILAQLEETLTPMQKSNVWAALNYEDFAHYYNHSLLMQIDVANVPETEMTFYVKADSLKKSCSIECWYEASFSSGLTQWLVENNLNQTDVDLSELITITSSTKNEMGSNSFSVRIIHVTEEECIKLADQVEKYIEFLHKQFSMNMEEHDILLVNRSYALVKDMELLNKQRTLVEYILASNANADRLINSFSTEETIYYDCLKNKQLSEENVPEWVGDAAQPEKEVVVQEPSVSKKYILLGMVLFAFGYLFYLFLKYIMNNKLRSTDDIGELYDIHQLGNIPQMMPCRKFLGCVDGWILKLRDSNKRVFSAEDATGLAAVAVKIAVQKANMCEVYCMGCSMTERTRKIAGQLRDTLKNENITLKILSNVLYDQGALEQLALAKCVFLLETAGDTFYEEIAKELELLTRQEIKVLGAIIVG